MPFQSEKQRKYLWANEPAIARDWTDKYGSRVKKQEGGGFNLDRYIYPKAHEQKYLTRNEWATDPNMYHNEIMNDYVTNVSKNLSEVPYAGNFLAAGAELGAPIASGIVSLPYDLRQAWDDWQTKDYNSIGDTFKGLLKSIDHQNPLDSVYHRTKGSLRPLGRRLENTWDAIKNEFGGSAEAAGMPINNNQSILPKARPRMETYIDPNRIPGRVQRSLTEEDENQWDWNTARNVGTGIWSAINKSVPWGWGSNALNFMGGKGNPMKMFNRNRPTLAQQRANQNYMNQQRITRDPQTGRMVGGAYAGLNAPGTSMFGSKTFAEMANKQLAKYGKTAPQAKVNTWNNDRGNNNAGISSSPSNSPGHPSNRARGGRMAQGGLASLWQR